MKFDGKLMQQFLRFASVGAIATVLQYVLLIMAVEWAGLNAVLSSSIAFILSAVVNYFLNRRFTFESANEHRVAMGRFAVVAGVGLALNAIVMTTFIQFFRFPYVAAQLIATGLVLIWNFFGNATWTFASRRVQPAGSPGRGQK